MPIQNAEIGAVFDEIADLLEIEGANPFRIRAYRNAARTLGSLGRSGATMVAQGADLAGKIGEIVGTGTCALLGRLRKEVPSGVAELLKVPGPWDRNG